MCNRTPTDVIEGLITLFLTILSIAGNTIDFKMNVINCVIVTCCSKASIRSLRLEKYMVGKRSKTMSEESEALSPVLDAVKLLAPTERTATKK